MTDTAEIKKKELGATLTQLWKWHEDCVAYRAQLRLNEILPKCVRYVEGDQWAKVTEDTADYPRPVFNILENILLNKKSQVLPSPIKIAYRSWDANADVEMFNDFAAYEIARLEQDRLNNESVWDSIIKGSHCLYYYWDENCVGIDGDVEGDIAAQIIDVSDFDVADTKERDVQKQEWIMICSRERVAHIKSLADSEESKALIDSDENQSVYSEIENTDEKYTTVLTRFFRHNGEVHWERATKSVVFMKARPLTPNANAIMGEEPDSETDAEDSFTQKIDVARRYPVVFFNWKKRNKSIYGRGEVEPLLRNQDYINRTAGCQILAASYEAMGGYVVDEDVLEGQEITDEPGQVITNYSRRGGKITELPHATMTAASIGVTDKLIDLTRKMAGSTEVMNGEIVAAGMSGAAIAQLQAEASKPIDDIKEDFMRSMKQVGEILEQFMRFYFTEKKYASKKQDGSKVIETFNSGPYKSMRFDVVAEAETGAIMSSSATASMLDTLFNAGKITLRTYIDCYPAELISGKQKLLEHIAQDEQVKQMQAALQQAQAQLQEQEQVISNAKVIVDENRTLREKLIALQAEYSQKIKASNELVQYIGAAAQEYYNDAKLMAPEVAQGRGLINSDQIQRQQSYSSGEE